MTGLLTDLYELIMAAGYFEAGKTEEKATFEFSIRRLPRDRNFVIAAGLEQAVEYLLNLRFEAAEIDYLRGVPQFGGASSGFFDYLRDFRFAGDVFAVAEGTPVFAGEPLLTIRAPLIQAQIPETYLLSTITFQSLIATKASRLVSVSGGRDVVEFGTRRAHTPEAGVLGARAAFLGGCSGTSNTLAGYRFGIPVVGTAAHSWVMSFESEAESFRRMQSLLGRQSVHLVDTYDTTEGTRLAIEVGEPFWGIRLDSGDFLVLSRQARAMLDAAGYKTAKIMASGDLDEYRLRDLVRRGAPIDTFGVGTELATSGDAPSMGAIYKMVEIDSPGGKRYTAKHSTGKNSLPGAKQIFRFPDYDVITRSSECIPGGHALQQPVILGGNLLQAIPDVHKARACAQAGLAAIPAALQQIDAPVTREIRYSDELKALIEQT